MTSEQHYTAIADLSDWRAADQARTARIEKLVAEALNAAPGTRGVRLAALLRERSK